jgi:glutamate carboxypeptidase
MSIGQPFGLACASAALAVPDEMTGGATDTSFANRRGKAIVVESFGLAGFGYHARAEYIDTGSIVPRLYLMTRMLMERGKKK